MFISPNPSEIKSVLNLIKDLIFYNYNFTIRTMANKFINNFSFIFNLLVVDQIFSVYLNYNHSVL